MSDKIDCWLEDNGIFILSFMPWFMPLIIDLLINYEDK